MSSHFFARLPRLRVPVTWQVDSGCFSLVVSRFSSWIYDRTLTHSEVHFQYSDHLKGVATLPCENISTHHSRSDDIISQGSVVTHLRCGGIFNYKFRMSIKEYRVVQKLARFLSHLKMILICDKNLLICGPLCNSFVSYWLLNVDPCLVMWWQPVRWHT